MKSLPLVFSAVALLGAITSTVLYLRIGDTKKVLQSQLVAAQARGTALEHQIAEAKQQNTVLEQRLTALDADLGATKSKLTAADARTVQLSRELNQAKSLAAAQDQAARMLGDQIESLRQELADARANPVAPEAVAAYKSTIADLERQLAAAKNGAAAPAVAGASTAAFSTRSPRAVLSVGPSSAFVILAYGANHGAQAGQSLDIMRGTDALASVLISDVRPNFSIAQVRPDTLRGALHKGDSALLTN